MIYTARFLTAAGLLFVWSGLGHGAIYKWVDERGVTNYTQYRPVIEQTDQKVKVLVPPPSPKSGGAAAQKRLENDLKTLADNQAQREKSAEKKAEAATEKQQRAENCQKARSNLAKLTTGGRKRIVGKDGVARYLPEEDRQQLIADAEKQVDESCD